MICDQCETVKHCTKYGCIPERIGKPKPAAQPAPVQECFWRREGYKECPAAQPSVPDAIHHTDLSESFEYIQGWNDCRQAMLEMMK